MDSGMKRRAIAAAAVVLAAAGAFYVAKVRQDAWVPPGPPEEAGRILFARKRCIRCHKIAGAGGMVGPDLTVGAARRRPDWMDSYLIDPRAVRADAKMPRPKITGAQRAAIVAYLTTLDGESPPASPVQQESTPCSRVHGPESCALRRSIAASAVPGRLSPR